jgi:hypothetical protein
MLDILLCADQRQCSNRSHWHCHHIQWFQQVVTVIFGIDLSGYNVNWGWWFWSSVYLFLPFEVNCQIVLESVTILNNASHIFIPKNMFLHMTNLFYCVIMLTFLLKMWMFKPRVGQLLTEYGVTKLGSVFIMCRCGEFAHYLAVRENIIVYVTFCCNHLSLFLHLQYKDLKKMFKCAPLSLFWEW